MKHFLILLTVVIFTHTLTLAQTAADSVKATVNQLFEGMKNSDPNVIRDAFADSAILQTIARNQQGQTIIRTDGVNGFAEQIAKLAKGAADERITFETIKIDGPLAVVWTPYKFYFNGNFSHCGVNSFQLVRINGKWKIQYLIDTRRRQGCEQ
ncbi:MAG TPA: nuclear transport factor 2 family protein [Chitinophagaceae bacterium]|nr:nuclear transport factor 2 family protein [Chitinophagaceae bacterium]